MVDRDIEILLVEDNANDEMLAMRAFQQQKIANQVHVVRDGAEALEFIFCSGAYADRSIENPKVILLDLKLPLLDGLEVLRQIRSDPRTRLIPVVMLTASSEERDLIESYKLGVNSYIVKPIDFEQFNEVAKHLGYYWLLLNRHPTSVHGRGDAIPDAGRPLISLSNAKDPMAKNDIEILLVEDNPNDELLAMHAFKKCNIANHVHVVRDGAEALEFVFCTGAYADRTVENPRVILLDLKLPLVDGIEVLRQIRSDPRTQLVPVVMLTSSSEERDVVEAYRLGVNSYIVKPVDFEQFNEVARHLGYYWLLLNKQPTPVDGSLSETPVRIGSA
jgi:two-component system response regulator